MVPLVWFALRGCSGLLPYDSASRGNVRDEGFFR